MENIYSFHCHLYLTVAFVQEFSCRILLLLVIVFHTFTQFIGIHLTDFTFYKYTKYITSKCFTVQESKLKSR